MADGLTANDDGGDNAAGDGGGTARGRRKRSDEAPRDVDGTCSRCGDPWPCLPCLTTTPPYVYIWNNS